MIKIPEKKMKQADIISHELIRMIVEQRLKPGDRLPSEKELIEKFKSSRGTVRETLKSLEILGLAERTTGPKGGTRVRAVTLNEAMQGVANFIHFQDITPIQIYKVKIVLEPLLVESVCGHLNEDHFKDLEQMISITELYLDKEASEIECRKAELDFHNVLAVACPNKFLSFLCSLSNYILYNFLFIDDIKKDFNRNFTENNLESHKKILKAFRNEDKTTAYALFNEHLSEAFDYIVNMNATISNSLISQHEESYRKLFINNS